MIFAVWTFNSKHYLDLEDYGLHDLVLITNKVWKELQNYRHGRIVKDTKDQREGMKTEYSVREIVIVVNPIKGRPYLDLDIGVTNIEVTQRVARILSQNDRITTL